MVIMNRKFSSIFGFVSKTDQIIISVRQETGIECIPSGGITNYRAELRNSPSQNRNRLSETTN